ncbi:MAG: nucleotide-binding protein [Bacteroidales bacterium]|nr:nucleotide-binding protein [Bacteroidales bacterium]
MPKDENIPEKENPIIFIGHGRKKDWNELADHLHYKHNIRIEAYETGARAGHTIRDILQSMLDSSSFALIVLTGEDIMANDEIRARQNVIHEAGLFQGRLGFNRALMLVEEGIENFSNVDGIQQLRYSKGNIKETFGEVLATIKREFEI